MAQTRDGAAKQRETILKKYGADYYEVIGAQGGQAKNANKGFGSLTKEERSRMASEAAKKRWAKHEKKG